LAIPKTNFPLIPPTPLLTAPIGERLLFSVAFSRLLLYRYGGATDFLFRLYGFLPLPARSSIILCFLCRFLPTPTVMIRKEITVADLSARTKANHYQRGIYLSCHTDTQHAKPCQGQGPSEDAG